MTTEFDSITGQMAERKRDALSAICRGPLWPILSPVDIGRPASIDDLYAYLLIDSQASWNVETADLAQAIASLQQYIGAILNGTEPGYGKVNWTGDEHAALVSDWLNVDAQYDTWAANKRLAEFPENFLVPAYRPDATDDFRQLAATLAKGQLDDDSVLAGIQGYLTQFESTANLSIVSGYIDGSGETVRAVVYLLGRTYEQPYSYYWRSCDFTQTQTGGEIPPDAWSDWKSVDIAVNDDSVVEVPHLVIFNSRLFISWFECSVVTVNSSEKNSDDPDQKIQISCNLAYLKIDKTWSALQTFDISETYEKKPFTIPYDSKGTVVVAANEPTSDLGESLDCSIYSTVPGNLCSLKFTVGLGGGTTPTPQQVPNYASKYSTDSTGTPLQSRQKGGAGITTMRLASVSDASNGTAEYLDKIKFDQVASPVRLNTVVGQKLVNLAAEGLDKLYQWSAQRLLEPGIPPSADGTAGPAVPMDFQGAYGKNFWEIFFHIPMLVADTLASQSQYGPSLQWQQRVFDPRAINQAATGTDTPPDYWKSFPITQSAGAWMGLSPSEEAYVPIDPYKLAYADPSHFRQATYMRYVGTLIAIGDIYYRMQTPDSLDQALECYTRASMLLGTRPDIEVVNQWLPRTLAEICAMEFPIELEALAYERALEINPIGMIFYAIRASGNAAPFLAPSNEQLLSLWDTIDSRRYNLRHSLDINGSPLSMPLYASPMDPETLLEGEMAAGTLSQTMLNIARVIPPFRYHAVASMAQSVVNTVIGFGQRLISYAEASDGRHQEMMQQQQLLDLWTFTNTANQQAVQIAQQSLNALNNSLAATQQRQDYYARLVSNGLSSLEKAAADTNDAASGQYALGAILVATGTGMQILPNIFGLADGGANWGAASQAAGQVSMSTGQATQAVAGNLSTQAAYGRRADDWQFQADQSSMEVKTLQMQVATQQLRVAAAKNSQAMAQAQHQQTIQMQTFLRQRYTNEQLYQWLNGRIAVMYRNAYDLALGVCQIAQSCWQYEVGDFATRYIYGSTWSDQHQGALAAEQLLVSLHQMEADWLSSKNMRKLEIVRTISVKELLGDTWTNVLSDAKEKGKSIDFMLGERLFDSDFPGHYLRQILGVSVTLPAAIGPLQNVQAILTQTNSALLIKPNAPAAKKMLAADTQSGLLAIADPNVAISLNAGQTVVLSSGQNDGGVISQGSGDGRYFPFEGTGVVSSWSLIFPNPTGVLSKSLVLDTLDDIILTVHYTAKDGGAEFGAAVTGYLN